MYLSLEKAYMILPNLLEQVIRFIVFYINENFRDETCENNLKPSNRIRLNFADNEVNN